MNEDAARENGLTLQNLLGVNDVASEKILGSSILISVAGKHPRLVEFLKVILERTFENVHTKAHPNVEYSCEIVTDPTYKKSMGPYVFLGSNESNQMFVSIANTIRRLSDNSHPFEYFTISCYASAMVLKTIHPELLVTASNDIIVDFKRLIKNPEILIKHVNIGSAFLAGGGAIGNAFLYALSTFNVAGDIKVVDPDFVSGGNLNRCLFFASNDIDNKKVDVLVSKAQPFFKNLRLTPLPYELSKVPENNGTGWLEKLIIGVDSRRARRNLQGEIPREVFDASTTGIAEVVIHYHKRPLEGACLGCIYTKEKQENAHETHVAQVLGVSLSQVQKQFIDKEAAKLIADKHSLIPNAILGIPYDTLFKQLCGEGTLAKSESEQVLAPLAFVSALAGAFLALTFVERHLNSSEYNYWRISPWTNPNFDLQQRRKTNPNCIFCNDETYLKVAKKFWG